MRKYFIPAAVIVILFVVAFLFFAGQRAQTVIDATSTPVVTPVQTPAEVTPAPEVVEPTQAPVTPEVPVETDMPVAPEVPTGGDVYAQLNSLVVVEQDAQVAYDRDEWKHWDSITGCWDVREQVLSDEAQPGSLVLLNQDKVQLTDVASACSIQSGVWNDPYTGTVITDPGALDIDHMIPLKKAAVSGGYLWDEAQKETYANDLTFTGHLLAVDAGENRSKSDRGPAEWIPDNQAYWCTYATNWVTVSVNYQLTVTVADKSALENLLATC
jgi:hypothetical protein